MTIPVLFEVEPMGVDGAMECNGQIHFFCSVQHRSESKLSVDTEAGEVDGSSICSTTQCEECGVSVVETSSI